MPMSVVRLIAFAAGLYQSWWSYRLFTNPFVACDHPGWRILDQLVSSFCESKQTDSAGVAVGVSATLAFLFAFWPRRRRDA